MQISFPHFRQRHAFEIIDTPVTLPEKTVGVLKLENSKRCAAVGWLRSICLATILLFLIL